MKYKTFKLKDKVNLKKNGEKDYIINEKENTPYFLLDNREENLDIWLTKIDRSPCDKVNLSIYNPKGNIEDTIFNFYHFDYEKNKHYNVILEYKKEKNSFFSRILGGHNNKHWEIKICELNKKNGKILEVCEIRGINTEDSLELENILTTKNIGIKIKIFNLLNKYKYDRVKLEYKQKRLFNNDLKIEIKQTEYSKWGA